MRTILVNANGIKVAVGTEARIVHDADGKVTVHKAASTRPTMTICPASHTLKVGTAVEITAEKAVQDFKYAACKAVIPDATK